MIHQLYTPFRVPEPQLVRSVSDVLRSVADELDEGARQAHLAADRVDIRDARKGPSVRVIQAPLEHQVHARAAALAVLDQTNRLGQLLAPTDALTSAELGSSLRPLRDEVANAMPPLEAATRSMDRSAQDLAMSSRSRAERIVTEDVDGTGSAITYQPQFAENLFFRKYGNTEFTDAFGTLTRESSTLPPPATDVETQARALATSTRTFAQRLEQVLLHPSHGPRAEQLARVAADAERRAGARSQELAQQLDAAFVVTRDAPRGSSAPSSHRLQVAVGGIADDLRVAANSLRAEDARLVVSAASHSRRGSLAAAIGDPTAHQATILAAAADIGTTRHLIEAFGEHPAVRTVLAAPDGTTMSAQFTQLRATVEGLDADAKQHLRHARTVAGSLPDGISLDQGRQDVVDARGFPEAQAAELAHALLDRRTSGGPTPAGVLAGRAQAFADDIQTFATHFAAHTSNRALAITTPLDEARAAHAVQDPALDDLLARLAQFAEKPASIDT